MKASQREALRARLVKLRDSLVAAGSAKIEPTRKDDATVGVADEDEQALAEMMQILASQRNKKQAELVALMDRALTKLANAPADYGVCEECEEPIAPRRLQLMPYATLCTDCQAEHDPRRGVTRRKLTDFDS